MSRTLDLFTPPPRATLHRPGVAALACVLLAVACVVSLATSFLPAALQLAGFAPLHFRQHVNLQVAGVIVRDSLLMAAGLSFSFANVARFAAPPLSAWPRRLMLYAICGYAALHCVLELKTILACSPQHLSLLTSPLPDRLLLPPHRWYLPAAIGTLALAAAALVAGLFYIVQLAGFLNDKVLREASLMILPAALLVVFSLVSIHVLALAAPRVPTIAFPGPLRSDTPWAVLEFLPLALACYFLCLGSRFRRAARLAA